LTLFHAKMKNARRSLYRKRIMRSFVPQIADELLLTRNSLIITTKRKKKRTKSVFATLKSVQQSFLGTTKKIFAKDVSEKDTLKD